MREFQKENFTTLIFSPLHKRSIKPINDRPKPVLFVGVYVVMFISSNLEDFNNDTKNTFEFLYKWINANRWSLNFDKIHFLQLTPKNSPEFNLHISYSNKLISKA